MSEHHGHRPEGERDYFLDKPGNVKMLINVFYVICAVLVVLGFVLHQEHHHPWEDLPAFYPLYGFVGIVVLVIIAKLLRRVAMRPEDYYDVD